MGVFLCTLVENVSDLKPSQICMQDLHIVYDRELEDGHWLYTMDANGNDTRLIAKGRDARWSPDRNQLVFTSERDKIYSIFVVNTDDLSERQITFGNETDLNPSWSPDGQHIVFTRIRPKQGNESVDTHRRKILIMNADGGDIRELTHEITGAYSSAVWHPGGQLLAVNSVRSGSSEIHLVQSDGTYVRQLTETPGEGASGLHLDWSPDGEHVLFTSLRSGIVAIYVTNKNGEGETRLTHDDSRINACGRWSPDGSCIVFHSTPSGRFDEVISLSEIYVMSADGTGIRQLTSSECSNGHPDW